MPHPHLHSLDLRNNHGQTMSETAVIMALVVIIVMVAVAAFGSSLGNLWAMLSSTLPGGG